MGLGRLRDGLAPTPPMGWNSWNRFAADVSEALVLETAEALVRSGMRDAGYRYVVIDDGWMTGERDGAGDLVADPAKFPRGIAPVAERVHDLGLRFGIYLDAGTKTCQGLAGSLAYEFRDARRLAEWGVDYVKVDWCHTDGLGPRAAYTRWALAIASARRPIVLSICEWGRLRPWEWAGSVGHLWRTTGDIADRWDILLRIVDRNAELHPYAGPDHWNDPDMLEVGNGGMSETEYRAHVGLWAILAAPLMAGNDLRTQSGATLGLLTNPEVIAVDQDALGRQGRRARAEGDAEVWVRELADGSRAALLFNRGATAREIAVDWHELGWHPRARALVRDLWQRTDAGVTSETYGTSVAPHDAVLVRLRSVA